LFDKINGLAGEASAGLVRAIRPAVIEGRVSIKEAVAVHDHVVDLVLRDAGIINYASNLDATPLIAKLNLAAYLERATAEQVLWRQSQYWQRWSIRRPRSTPGRSGCNICTT
jgi:hypothetical protein